MVRYDYQDIINKICCSFNKSYDTSYTIIYATKEKVQELNPQSRIGENAGGVYNNKNKTIYIFSDVIDRIRNMNYSNSQNANDNGLAFLILACFHELEHRIQNEYPEKLRKQPPFSKDMYDIEKLIMYFVALGKNSEIYKKNHDNFYFEIDADLKGVSNAVSFINAYGIEGINPKYYEFYQKYNQYRIQNYDIPVYIKILNELVSEYPQLLSDSRYIDNKNVLSFFNKSGKFKTISELMENQNVITPYMVSSEMFLQSIDRNNITDEQRKFILLNMRAVRDEHLRKMIELKKSHEETMNVCQELNNYTHIGQTSNSKSVNFMYDDNYYEFLNRKIIELNSKDKKDVDQNCVR